MKIILPGNKEEDDRDGEELDDVNALLQILAQGDDAEHQER